MYGSVFDKVRQSLKVINKSKIDNMYKMFEYYEGEKLDLSEFDTSNVKGMGSMFDDCNKLDKINVKNRAVNSSFRTGYISSWKFK